VILNGEPGPREAWPDDRLRQSGSFLTERSDGCSSLARLTREAGMTAADPGNEPSREAGP